MSKDIVIVVLSNKPLNFDFVILFLLKSATVTIEGFRSLRTPFTMKLLSVFPQLNLELSVEVETNAITVLCEWRKQNLHLQILLFRHSKT